MNTIRHRVVVLAIIFASPLFAQTRSTTRPATRPATRDVLPPLPAGIVAHRDLKYAQASKAQMLDIYLPEKVDRPLPLVIYIHGGGWSGGDKKFFPAQVLVSQGYAVASINYRFIKEAIFPAQIHDCKAAVRWLRAHAKQYNFDPDHFGAWGDSAGGHLVALLGTSADAKEIEGTVGGDLDQSSRVQCVIDWYGPTDMSVFFDQAEKQAGKVENIFKKDPDHSVIAQLFGGPPGDHKELVQQANPVHFVTKHDPPFLIMHGDKDNLVPLAQSEMLADALKKAGVEVHLEVIEGAGHGGEKFFTPTARGMMLQFFNKHLKGGQPETKLETKQEK